MLKDEPKCILKNHYTFLYQKYYCDFIIFQGHFKCVCVRDRERQRDGERLRERQRERDGDRQRQRQGDKKYRGLDGLRHIDPYLLDNIALH